MPEPRCLKVFWEKVKTAIKSLDESFAEFETRFRGEHIATFGPLLLGIVGWQQISDR